LDAVKSLRDLGEIEVATSALLELAHSAKDGGVRQKAAALLDEFGEGDEDSAK
jgi:hypothetical protein